MSTLATHYDDVEQRQPAAGDYRERREMPDDRREGEGKNGTTAGQNIWAPSVHSMSKVMPVRIFILIFIFIINLCASTLAPHSDLRPSPLDEVIIFIWFIMSPVGPKHLYRSVDGSFLWRDTFKVRHLYYNLFCHFELPFWSIWICNCN